MSPRILPSKLAAVSANMGKASRRRDRGQPTSSKEDTAARDAHYRDHPIVKAMHSMYSMPGRIDIDELVDAARDGNELKVCELLEASANPNRPNYWTSWTPLACAALKGHSFIVQQLLNHRADPSWMPRVSPLAEAANAGQLDCVRRLLSARTRGLARRRRVSAAVFGLCKRTHPVREAAAQRKS